MEHFTDEELELSADQARQTELNSIHGMLLHLKEMERRKLYSRRGCESIYDYAIKKFKYSTDEAYRRIAAMRLLKQFNVEETKEIEAKLKDGSLQLTHLTQAQVYFNKIEHTKAEKLEILAKLENTSKTQTKKILYNEEVKARYSFEADKSLEEMVERLKGLNPHLSFDQLMRKICEMALEKLDPMAKAKRIEAKANKKAELNVKKQAPYNEKSRASAKSQTRYQSNSEVRSRYIPAHVKRAVWLKAEGKCENCKSIFALEIDHHKIPFAKGGSNNRDNLRLLCRSCNQRHGIECYGQVKMEKYLQSSLR